MHVDIISSLDKDIVRIESFKCNHLSKPMENFYILDTYFSLVVRNLIISKYAVHRSLTTHKFICCSHLSSNIAFNNISY